MLIQDIMLLGSSKKVVSYLLIYFPARKNLLLHSGIRSVRCNSELRVDVGCR